jgi:hypothetical protein
MGDQLARAEDFEDKAEKKLSSWGMFGSKFEDAADLFDKSANHYKLAKSCNICSYSLFLMIIYMFLRLFDCEFCCNMQPLHVVG